MILTIRATGKSKEPDWDTVWSGTQQKRITGCGIDPCPQIYDKSLMGSVHVISLGPPNSQTSHQPMVPHCGKAYLFLISQ